jgi:hypothetical protein
MSDESGVDQQGCIEEADAYGMKAGRHLHAHSRQSKFKFISV